MFENKDTANGFLQYLNSRHNSIKFTIEFKQNNEIPFLDILVKRCPNNTFVTSIYRKKTFTGLYTKWDSFTLRVRSPQAQKLKKSPDEIGLMFEINF